MNRTFEKVPKKPPQLILFLFQTNSVSNSKGNKRGAKSSISRGPKPEDDFHNGNQSSSEDEDTKIRKKLPGSRPHSGSSSRPHSGTSLGRPGSGTSLGRPGSGTSGGRPQSGTIINRPNSGTSSAGASPQTSRDKKSRTTKNHVESKIPKNNIDKTTTKGLGSRTSIDTKLDLKPLQNGPKKASGSPELSASQMQDPMLDATLTSRSVSRMNRKSLREISRTDVSRMSLAKSTEVSNVYLWISLTIFCFIFHIISLFIFLKELYFFSMYFDII